jgi:transcription termination factor Rho
MTEEINEQRSAAESGELFPEETTKKKTATRKKAASKKAVQPEEKPETSAPAEKKEPAAETPAAEESTPPAESAPKDSGERNNGGGKQKNGCDRRGQDRGKNGRNRNNDRRGKNNRNRDREPQIQGNPENLPPLSLHEMQLKPINEVKSMAEEYGVQDIGGLSKHQVIFELLKAHARRGGPLTGRGILEILPDGYGFLRSPLNSYQPAPDDIYISPAQIRRFGIRPGDLVTGSIRAPKSKERFFALHWVETINGQDPEEARKRVPFENLTPLFPNERLVMETTPKEISMRVMDLVTPVGKGQRGLIVAPPRTGKTVLMQKIANSITANNRVANTSSHQCTSI